MAKLTTPFLDQVRRFTCKQGVGDSIQRCLQIFSSQILQHQSGPFFGRKKSVFLEVDVGLEQR